MKYVIGIDVGNGATKIVTEKGDYTFDSGLARASEKQSLLGDQQYVFDNEFVIGQVKNYKSFIDTNRATNRYSNEYYQRLVRYCIANVLLEENNVNMIDNAVFNVNVMSGVPSDEVSNSVDVLKRAIEGDFEVKVNDQTVKFSVSVLDVKAQPLGTLFNQILGNNANFLSLATKYKSEQILVLDGGQGTIDTDVLSNMAVVNHLRSTMKNSGMYNIYEEVSNKLNAIDNDICSNVSSVELQFNNDTYNVNKKYKIEAFKEIKLSVLEEKAKRDIEQIKLKMQDSMSSIDTILMTGGYSEVMHQYYKDAFNMKHDVILVDNAQLANARGFYKYAKLLSKNNS